MRRSHKLWLEERTLDNLHLAAYTYNLYPLLLPKHVQLSDPRPSPFRTENMTQQS